MSKDWLDNSIYDHFDDLDLSGLAWECLRRNESYRSDYAAREGDSACAAWGLRFRG
ncbi:transcriptional regulator domain-containing protein [Nitratireductor sp.]|uniref:transcriptional regulator domain-containing protein n=1 Tax=Nitratireductor sp. TaxID=1872084 RepID=UPI0025FB96F3|nr:DUF6499 domain-containing protein [Nitratireductor sp.]